MDTLLLKPVVSRLHSVLVCIIVLSNLCAASPACASLEQVTLQLKWLHQFQFAGYYAAVQHGFYRDAGLNVTILPATPGKDPVQEVINGKAQYGVGTSSLLLLRNAGKPVVTLAVLFQHSPFVLLTKEHTANQAIHSLVGKRLMLEPQAEELLAYLKKEGVPVEKMQLVDHSFTINDLMLGKIDAVSGYITTYPYELSRAGFAYHAYTPRSAGIDFYGDNLFTTENELKNHPARAKAFREASLKGWHYALQYPEEIIDLIISTYAPQSDRAHLTYEAEQIRQLIQPDLVEIGYMHAGRWRHIADTYSEIGMLPKNIDLKNFLYDPTIHKDLTLSYWIISTLLGLTLIVVAVRLIKTSSSLKKSEEHAALLELLRNSEESNSAIIQTAMDGFWLTDQLGQLLKVNQTYCIMSGYSEPELLSMKVIDLHSTNAIDDVFARAEKTMTTGEDVFETRHQRKDGSVFDVEVSAQYRSSEGGQFVVFLRDITHRKRLEKEIKEKQQFLAGIIENSGMLIAIKSFEGRYQIVNRKWEEVIGLSRQDVVGKRDEELFPHPFGQIIRSHDLETMLGGSCIEVEEEIEDPVAGKRYGISTKFPLISTDGSVMGVCVMSTDITERKLTEEKLRQAKEAAELANYRLALATKVGGVGIWEFDFINNKLVWDEQMFSLYGLTPDVFKATYEEWITTLHPDDVLRVDNDVQLALSGEKEYVLEFRVLWPDYSVHTISAAGTVQRDASGQAVRMIGTNWDITAEKQAEENIRSFSRQLKEKNSELKAALIAAEQANETKSQFLSNMSHEIRTPLNAIIGFSALVLQASLPPLQHDYLGKIHTSGELLLNLINDILDVSKIEAGKLTIEQVLFRPAVLISNVIGMLDQTTADKGLCLLVRTSDDIAPSLRGDPHRLVQILVNLLSNAVKFTDRGEVMLETVLLKQENNRQQLKFTIRDTGIGIPTEQIDKLFQPFTQADESTTRRFGGTGLGLSISKQLVELMGGEIECESRPGEGSSFSFTAWFGIGPADYDVLQQSVVAMSIKPDFSGYRILLVEDNKINRQLASLLLEETGADVDEAVNGQEAVAMIAGSSTLYDLVLMDIQMPVIDGYEATRLIRADGRFALLPIIAMTAHAMEEERQKILQTGMNAHIAKPIDARSMLQVIGSFLCKKPLSVPCSEKHEYSSSAINALLLHEDIDVSGALDRLEGNEKIYTWLLNSFVENKAETLTAIQEALNEGYAEQAVRCAHTLKSSAGTIGAVKLSSLAQTLEASIEQSELLSNNDALLDCTVAEMERVVTILASCLSPTPASAN